MMHSGRQKSEIIILKLQADNQFFLLIQSVLFAASMSKEIIIQLFKHASDISKHFLALLIEQSFRDIGRSESLQLIVEWKILSLTLNTSSKLNCLRDKNHRLLIIEYLKAEATKHYKGSYFNHAKIDKEYLSYLKEIGPFEFSEILTIVNKLKLIQKHHKARMEAKIFIESHIEEKIRKIMEICNSEKRHINSTLNKFKTIVEFQDRIELVKELGKLLRQSWSSEKKCPKNESLLSQVQHQKKTFVNHNSEIVVEFYAKQYCEENDKTGLQSFFDESLDFN